MCFCMDDITRSEGSEIFAALLLIFHHIFMLLSLHNVKSMLVCNE